MYDLKVEIGRVLISIIQVITSQGWLGCTDKSGDNFIDQGETITFVGTKRFESGNFIRIQGLFPILINGCSGRQAFPSRFNCCTLPMAITEVAQSITTGKPTASIVGNPPGMRIGSKGRFASHERNHLGDRCSTICIRDISSLCGIHHIASAP